MPILTTSHIENLTTIPTGTVAFVSQEAGMTKLTLADGSFTFLTAEEYASA